VDGVPETTNVSMSLLVLVLDHFNTLALTVLLTTIVILA
jgi:hypothetical protein